jgi:flavin-dependent dehydrogenase
VGDAAAVLDPVSAHGVLRALISAMMAAHLMVQVVQQALTPAEGADVYTHWMRDWFLADVSRLGPLYARLAGTQARLLA